MIRLIASLLMIMPLAAHAAGDAKHPHQLEWAFDGPLGSVDKQSAQRGFQIYREVCAACHGINRISFRNLEGLGFSEGEVKTIAAEYSVVDGPNDDGEMFERAGRPSDRFPKPFANEKAGRAMHNGAYPVDLSLIIKARPDGANYVHALLTGYEDAPSDFPMSDGTYYNPYFAGNVIKMPPPLVSDGQVEYQDETKATVDQMAHDVVNFLQWTAEPEMQARKQMGMKVMVFLLVMTVFFYLAKKRIWSRIEH